MEHSVERQTIHFIHCSYDVINFFVNYHIVTGRLFCMCPKLPSYASVILKKDDQYFFFRDELGMVAENGASCITENNDISEL